MRYSASNNGVTLKSGLCVVQGHQKWYHSKFECGFLFALYSKWPPSCTISEKKRYIGRRSRFSYPCIRRPIHGEKSLMICLAVSKKTGVCQTDGQTSFCSTVRELCTASRGKNSISLRSTMTKDWRYTNVSYKHCYNSYSYDQLLNPSMDC